jgi:hypothetical protein
MFSNDSGESPAMPDHIDETEPQSIELRRFDLHGLWRVLLWGSSAAMALAIVAGTAFSDLGAERIHQVMAALMPPPVSEPAKPAAPQIDARQIAALEAQARDLTQTVRGLTAERDRVKARLATLEQSLSDITGAIRKQAAQQAAQATPPATTAPKEPPQQVAAAPTPPPVVSPPQVVAATPSPTTTEPPQDAPAVTASTPPVVEPSPPLEGPIPLPRTRVAALERPEPITTHQVGIDLGGAASLEALRARWSSIKANVGPELVGLTPSYIIRQKAAGIEYHLVLGPIPTSAAAVQLCSKLAASRVSCRAGTFAVQKMAERHATEREPPRPVAPLPSPMRDGIMSK